MHRRVREEDSSMNISRQTCQQSHDRHLPLIPIVSNFLPPCLRASVVKASSCAGMKALIPILFALVACSGDGSTAKPRIEAPWARATAPSAEAGGAFATLINDGGIADALISASSDAAEEVQLHTHIKDDQGVLHMTAVERIDLPAHGSVLMKPGSHHFMLMGLKKPLKEGESFPLTCRFAQGGSLTITVRVQAAAAMGPAMVAPR